MMDWTDRHCRVFHRLLSKHARLYTEMVTADAIVHGDRQRLIGFSEVEHPVALQLGGSDPERLAMAARIGEQFGYDEINLNVGCPSSRVQSGRFGACLMAEPALVGECISKMRAAVDIPVTVKCRIGIDDQDDEEGLQTFVATVADAGCKIFIVHARKAWLNGLSPKQNREVPPLNYDRVYRLKAAHPDLKIIINGGIETLHDCEGHLQKTDGVMLGRAAYQRPFILSNVDHQFFASDAPAPSRHDVLKAFRPYVESRLAEGVPLNSMTRHIIGLMHACPRGRLFRRTLSGPVRGYQAGLDVFDQAIDIAATPIRLDRDGEGRGHHDGADISEADASSTPAH